MARETKAEREARIAREEIDWVAHAYHVDVVKEEPVTTIVRTFARVDNANR